MLSGPLLGIRTTLDFKPTEHLGGEGGFEMKVIIVQIILRVPRDERTVCRANFTRDG